VLEKPSHLSTAFALSAFLGGRCAAVGLSPFFFPPGVLAALAFSSIHCGIHTHDFSYTYISPQNDQNFNFYFLASWPPCL
jgi:hypothetical protein